jgi:hypothetical protein
LEGFVCRFWNKLAFNTAYHPQTDGQTKRVNKVLEDMLRMYAMHQPKKWEDYLPLVEFAYNNGYQESLKMSPFEALYVENVMFQSVGVINGGHDYTGTRYAKRMEKEIVQIK